MPNLVLVIFKTDLFNSTFSVADKSFVFSVIISLSLFKSFIFVVVAHCFNSASILILFFELIFFTTSVSVIIVKFAVVEYFT